MKIPDRAAPARLAAAALLLTLGGCAATGGVETTQQSRTLLYDSGRAPVATTPVPRAPAPALSTVAPVQAMAAPQMETRGIVYFDFDRYDIQPRYQALIAQHAQALRADPGATAAVEGHTDLFGSTEYNVALGQRRAEAVRRALLLLGVQDRQLEAVSFGETQPVAEGEDAASRAQNRRAEIRYRR